MNLHATPPAAKGWLDTPWHVTLTMVAGVLCWSVGVIIFKEALLYFVHLKNI